MPGYVENLNFSTSGEPGPSEEDPATAPDCQVFFVTSIHDHLTPLRTKSFRLKDAKVFWHRNLPPGPKRNCIRVQGINEYGWPVDYLLKIRHTALLAREGRTRTGHAIFNFGDRMPLRYPRCQQDADESIAMDVTKYLGKHGRVRTAKLRGYYSQGLIISTEFLPGKLSWQHDIGDNMAEALGITKYVPPPQFTTNGLSLPDDPRFPKYTDIENIKNFPDALQEGEEVRVTEKLHGTNFRIGWVDDDTFLVGTHRRNIKEDPDNLYWKVTLEHDLRDRLPKGFVFYGEIYGRKIQKLQYGGTVPTVRFFDVFNVEDGVYLGAKDFAALCEGLDVPTVPFLYTGPWEPSLLTLGDGKSNLADHIKEGIVITPLRERWDARIGRVILKHLSERYLMKRYD